MAKAALPDVRKAENWSDLGRAIDRVRTLHRLSLKEFADALQRNERQVARWFEGTERPQLEVVFGVVKFRQSVVVALAELAGDGVIVETVVRVQRRA